MRARTTLVLGGTVKTGRRVAERLTARGLPVRIGSRFGAPPFDWENPDTWPAVLRDVSRRRDPRAGTAASRFQRIRAANRRHRHLDRGPRGI